MLVFLPSRAKRLLFSELQEASHSLVRNPPRTVFYFFHTCVSKGSVLPCPCSERRRKGWLSFAEFVGLRALSAQWLPGRALLRTREGDSTPSLSAEDTYLFHLGFKLPTINNLRNPFKRTRKGRLLQSKHPPLGYGFCTVESHREYC